MRLLVPGKLRRMGAVVRSASSASELAHELPAGLRYRTPLGTVADPGMLDWRTAMERR
jgi:hypothetical protein